MKHVPNPTQFSVEKLYMLFSLWNECKVEAVVRLPKYPKQQIYQELSRKLVIKSFNTSKIFANLSWFILFSYSVIATDYTYIFQGYTHCTVPEKQLRGPFH